MRAARAAAAQAYFRRHAAEWDRIRTLHVADAAVEAAIRAALAEQPFRSLLDLGTGTGRMLELFGRDSSAALGVDLSLDMLALARARLERAGLQHCSCARATSTSCRCRATPSTSSSCIRCCTSSTTARARCARRRACCAPGGRLLVVDFAPHDRNSCASKHAHRRLGFAAETVTQWLDGAGLDVVLHASLAPEPGSDGKITVSLWLARDPRVCR